MDHTNRNTPSNSTNINLIMIKSFKKDSLTLKHSATVPALSVFSRSTRYKKESKKIVRHVLRLILRSVTKVIVSDASVNTKDVSVGSSVRTMSQSIAIQTEHKVLVKRYVDDEDVNSSSVASCIELETKWRKDFRSLRDSHVRLVLRQLRQLQDIERLSRVLCCTHSPGTSTSSCQIDLTEY
ncbi:unnamed protein product [Euphydryas editha]|uniref:Uncharacterized protein n=1 Tax=Euphydryas editha TaxID=104508 RepID=A0AAU9UZG0_EUPED|nr:unnamed protein product [Euphydryas editha]